MTKKILTIKLRKFSIYHETKMSVKTTAHHVYWQWRCVVDVKCCWSYIWSPDGCCVSSLTSRGAWPWRVRSLISHYDAPEPPHVIDLTFSLSASISIRIFHPLSSAASVRFSRSNTRSAAVNKMIARTHCSPRFDLLQFSAEIVSHCHRRSSTDISSTPISLRT